MGKHDYSEMPLRESATNYMEGKDAGPQDKCAVFFAGHVVRLIDLLTAERAEVGKLREAAYQADLPFAVGDRVRMRSAEMHASRGVGTIFAIDGDSATVSWDTIEHAGIRLAGATTTVFHADIRRAVER